MPDSEDAKVMLDFIINLPLFEFVNTDDLSMIAEKMKFITLNAGEVLFHEWDRADFVCFIESGELNVTKKTGADTHEVRAVLKRGRSIGEISIINNFPRSATVVARTDVRLAVFPSAAFEEIVENQKDVAIHILKGLASLLSMNLKKASSRLEDNMLPMG